MKHFIGKVALALLNCSLGAASASRLRERQAAVTVTRTVTGAGAQATVYDWRAGAVRDYPIHSSCNATERALLNKGLDEAVELAAHAKDHVLRFGNTSELYNKYFGTAPTPEVIGW